MTLTLDLPPDLQDALSQTARRQGQTPAQAVAEDLRLLYPSGAAERERLAVALYHARLISQGRAAALAGLSRAEFLDALARHGTPAIQYGIEEALGDAERITTWEGGPSRGPDRSPEETQA